jgi:hypothetical protein
MSGSVMESINRQINEFEWRLNIEAEKTPNSGSDNNNDDATNDIINQIANIVNNITATLERFIGGDSK